MDTIQLLRQSFDDLHESLRADRAALAQEWLWWQPAETLNHIGFLWWHLVRDEDTVIGHVAKRGELWQIDGWHERLGMDANEQGTGLAPERLAAFRYDWDLFQEYAEAVWEATGPALTRLEASALDEPAWPGSGWNVARQIVEGCLCHSWVHLGEIRSLMGLRGWRFSE